MDDISPEFIERYQMLLERDPKSKVFAPLAEAYRKIGLNSRAYTLCKSGLEFHPNFAGGHISMAKTLIDLEEPEKAIQHLEQATDLAPENIMAHQVLAELLLKLKHHKEALKAYKMVLFLSPENVMAQKAVKKLESLTAEDFSESVFSRAPSKESFIEETPQSSSDKNDARQKRLERFLSLIDVYIIRNDLDKAFDVYGEARLEFATHPELKKRLKVLRPESFPEKEEAEEIQPERPSRRFEANADKAMVLRSFLSKINKHRKDKFED